MARRLGASLSQERATRVKGRMQSVVHMIRVNTEQNTSDTCTHSTVWRSQQYPCLAAYPPGAHGEGVSGVDGGDGLHEEGGEQVGEAEVGQQQVQARVLHGLVVPDGRHH